MHSVLRANDAVHKLYCKELSFVCGSNLADMHIKERLRDFEQSAVLSAPSLPLITVNRPPAPFCRIPNFQEIFLQLRVCMSYQMRVCHVAKNGLD